MSEHEPTESAVLRCVYLGSNSTWPIELIAVAVDRALFEVHDAVRTLTERDRLRIDDSGSVGMPPRHDWVAPLVSAKDSGHPEWEAVAYTRVCAHLRTAGEAAATTLGRTVPAPAAGSVPLPNQQDAQIPDDALGQARGYRYAVPGIVRQATRLGWGADAAHLAVVWWAVADHLAEDASEQWIRELAAAGEDAGLSTQSPPILSEVLDAAARCAGRLGDHLAAETWWVHALAVWRFLDQPAPGIPVLEELLRLYTQWPRHSKACDALYDLQRVHARLGNNEQECWARVRHGVLMMRMHRPDTALTHARYAREMLATGTARVIGTGRHATTADVDILIGRARWEDGDTARARAAWHDALARLVDVDENRAQQVRALLALADGTALPTDEVLEGFISDATTPARR